MEGGRKKNINSRKKEVFEKRGRNGDSKKSKRFDLKVRIKEQEAEKNKQEFGKKEEMEQYMLAQPNNDREKFFLMWGGVAFFMFVIVGFWFFNIRQSFNSASADRINSFKLDELSKITDDFSENLVATADQINEVKKILEAQGKQAASSTIKSASSTNPQDIDSSEIDRKDLELIKQEILELEKNKRAETQ